MPTSIVINFDLSGNFFIGFGDLWKFLKLTLVKNVKWNPNLFTKLTSSGVSPSDSYWFFDSGLRTNCSNFQKKYIWQRLYHHYMGVSENSGTPKSSMLIGFSIINHPFWGTPIFGNTHICFVNKLCNPPTMLKVGHRLRNPPHPNRRVARVCPVAKPRTAASHLATQIHFAWARRISWVFQEFLVGPFVDFCVLGEWKTKKQQKDIVDGSEILHHLGWC